MNIVLCEIIPKIQHMIPSDFVLDEFRERIKSYELDFCFEDRSIYIEISKKGVVKAIGYFENNQKHRYQDEGPAYSLFDEETGRLICEMYCEDGICLEERYF